MQGFLNRKVPLVAKSNHGRYNFIIFKLSLDDPKFFFSYELLSKNLWMSSAHLILSIAHTNCEKLIVPTKFSPTPTGGRYRPV